VLSTELSANLPPNYNIGYFKGRNYSAVPALTLSRVGRLPRASGLRGPPSSKKEAWGGPPKQSLPRASKMLRPGLKGRLTNDQDQK